MLQNNNSVTLNTGSPRHVPGHAVSGAIAGGVIALVDNMIRVKNGELTKSEATQKTIKASVQGAVATATAISVANNLGDPNKSVFQALSSLAIGASSLYLIEKFEQKLDEKKVGELGE